MPAEPAATAPEHRLQLEPYERRFVTWEEHDPLDRPEDFTLDVEQVLAAVNSEVYDTAVTALNKFRDSTLPMLKPDERAQLRAALAPTVPPQAPDPYSTYPIRYLVAALVGCHAEILACSALIPDGEFKADYYNSWESTPEWMLFGLPDRGTLIGEFERIGLHLRTPEALVAWLALTEFDALGMLGNSICAATSKSQATAMAKVIGRVVAPQMAAVALQVAVLSKAPQVGRKWLADHPLEAAIGLAPSAAAGGSSKLAKAARELFVTIGPDVLELASQHIEPATFEKLVAKLDANTGVQLAEATSEDLPSDLREVFAAIKPGRASDWIPLVSLPPIQIAGKQLGAAQLKVLLSALRSTPIDETSGLFTLLKKHADPGSLDQFAWKLLELWNANGNPSKDKWAMGAIAHLGGDHCAVQLAPLIRAWPKASAFQRSLFGLDCLRAIGSDTALMTLSTVGEKLKYKSVKTKAREVMAEIAADRNISREELDDCIIPDCGLDAGGRRSFDFGPRQFEFVLGPNSKPMVRDAAGKLRANPPKPNKADDPAQSEAATNDWKTFKKTLQQTLKIQAGRMKDAMVNGRRWSSESFEKLFIEHPFMLNLARQLVFVIDGVTSFRVTEDQSLANVAEDEIAIPPGSEISILHPANLGLEERAAWGELLSDYGIIPPFPQMSRELYPPLPEELEMTVIRRRGKPKVDSFIAYKVLRAGGWSSDWDGYEPPAEHLKHYAAADVTAILTTENDWPTGSISFVKGRAAEDIRKRRPLKIRDVDQVAFSETLRSAAKITEFTKR